MNFKFKKWKHVTIVHEVMDMYAYTGSRRIKELFWVAKALKLLRHYVKYNIQ